MRIALFAAAILCPLVARAASLRLDYAGDLAGLPILTAQADLTTTAASYLIRTHIQMTGGARLLVRGQSDVISQGAWAAGFAAPTHLDSEATWNGTAHRLIVDFPAGVPVIRLMQPPDPHRRAALDRTAIAGTTDALGLIVGLIHQLGATGACATSRRVFDGHGVTELTLAPSATDPRRCDFTTRKVAGFRPDENPRRVGHGYALFAPAAAGLPIVPTRIVFRGGLLGDAVLRLTSAAAIPPA